MKTNLLKSLRESAGLSQRDLATAVGISRTKVFNLEQKSSLGENEVDLFSKALAKTIDLSYVAGLFDRASTFSITRIAPGKIHALQKSTAYIARIQFSSNHKLLVDILMSVFGTGKVCPQKYNNGTTRWIYYSHNQSVDVVLEMLIPYLKLKREKALVLQEFRQFLETSRDEYRAAATSIGSFVLPEQQALPLGDRRLLSRRAFGEKYRLSNGAVDSMLADVRLKGYKIYSKRFPNGKYAIAPFVEGGKITRVGKPLSEEVLAKYEYFYNRIREV